MTEKKVTIKLLPKDFFIYGHPVILMMHPQKAYRAVYGQRLLEIQKMLVGIVESVIALENIMNQTNDSKKLFLENVEVEISDEKIYWIHVYLIDNAILRLFACLEKIAQMCRCYLECKKNTTLSIKRKCGCIEDLSEGNCAFGTLLSLSETERDLIDKKLFDVLLDLNKNKSIEQLRPFRNSFAHKKHLIDGSVGIDPTVKSKKINSIEEINFNFETLLPSLNWFRVEIVGAHNGIIDFLESIGNIMFPKDFEIQER